MSEMNKDKLLTSISIAVASYLDNGREGDINALLNNIFPDGFTASEKEQALAQAKIYSLEANIPGNPPDGEPGYLSSDINLKEAVLNELKVMEEADFDREEHAELWQTIQKNVKEAPDEDFNSGVDVNCPDDYILSLKLGDCASVLKNMN